MLGLPIARYADRPTTSRPRLIAIALATWSAMTALCGMAQNFVQLLLARIGVGVGEAGCTPAAHSLISDMVPKERRASALAFYALGIPIGTVLGMMIGGLLADAVGWRWAFIVVGAPGVLLALVVITVMKDPRHRVAAESLAAAPPPIANKAAMKAIFGSRALILLMVAASSAAFLSYGKTTWATIFFQRTHGLTPGEVGLYFGIINGAAGIAGTWLGGKLADKYGATNRKHVLTAPALGMLVAAPLAYFAYSRHHLADGAGAADSADAAEFALLWSDLFGGTGAGCTTGAGNGGGSASLLPEPDRAGVRAALLRHDLRLPQASIWRGQRSDRPLLLRSFSRSDPGVLLLALQPTS